MSADERLIAARTVGIRRPTLTAEERTVLGKRRFSASERALVAHLLAPFEETLRTRVINNWTVPEYVDNYCQNANHFLARMMVALDSARRRAVRG